MGAIAVVVVELRTNIEPERGLPAEDCASIGSEKLDSCGDLAAIFGVDSKLPGYPRRISLLSEAGSRSSYSSIVLPSRDSLPCIKGPRPMACAAISRRRLRSSTSSSC